jgi:hypothetical protein
MLAHFELSEMAEECENWQNFGKQDCLVITQTKQIAQIRGTKGLIFFPIFTMATASELNVSMRR